MKNLLCFCKLTFVLIFSNLSIFTLNSKADNFDDFSACNKAVVKLKDYGFNFQKFTDSKNIFQAFGALHCGFPPNSNNIIMLMPNPIRIFVVEDAITSQGYCVMLATNRVFKTKQSNC